jgi:hypothetical protein
MRQAVEKLSIPGSTVHKIMQSCWQFKSYKYQQFQQVTAQDEEVHYTYHCDLLQNVKRKKWIHDLSRMSQKSVHHSLLYNERLFK